MNGPPIGADATHSGNARAGEVNTLTLFRKDRLQKGTVSQPSDPGHVCKGLGVAKRYCQIKVIGNTVLQFAFTTRGG